MIPKLNGLIASSYWPVVVLVLPDGLRGWGREGVARRQPLELHQVEHVVELRLHADAAAPADVHRNATRQREVPVLPARVTELTLGRVAEVALAVGRQGATERGQVEVRTERVVPCSDRPIHAGMLSMSWPGTSSQRTPTPDSDGSLFATPLRSSSQLGLTFEPVMKVDTPEASQSRSTCLRTVTFCSRGSESCRSS